MTTFLTTYTNLTVDQQNQLYSYLAHDYFTKTGIRPIGGLTGTLQLSVTDGNVDIFGPPTYVVPTQSQLFSIAPSVIAADVAERKRIADFKNTPVSLTLTNLVIMQMIDPTIKDLADAVTYLRPKVQAAASNPINAEKLR